MTDSENRWERVGAAVAERMAQLGLGPTELAKKAGVSRETIRPLIQAERDAYRNTTLHRLSLALWERPDAIDRLLSGEELMPPLSKEIDEVRAEIRDVRDRLQRLEDAVDARLRDFERSERREL